jgi:transposase InsO family protein
VCYHPLGDLLETGQALDYQPGPGVPTKKRRRDRLITLAARHPDWALGSGDEAWWTRLAQPSLHTWTDQPLRLVEQSVAKDDLDPKALACYGLLVRSADEQPEEVWLRFVDGRPVSAVTTQFLADCCTRLAARGKAALLLIWDNASWHISKAVQSWIREHNRQVKQEGRGVRILPCQLPVKSPWLNPMEPKWVHGKRAVVEPTRLLSAIELEDRICEHFRCHRQEHLIAQQAA